MLSTKSQHGVVILHRLVKNGDKRQFVVEEQKVRRVVTGHDLKTKKIEEPSEEEKKLFYTAFLQGFREIKQSEAGKIQLKTLDELLDEL